MNHRIIARASLLAVVSTGCAIGTDDPTNQGLSPEEEALLAEGDLGTKVQAYGEITCPTATPNQSPLAVDQTMYFAADHLDNPQCKWTRVLQVNSAPAGTFFYLYYNDVIPINRDNCESISVTMDIYKYNQGAWVVDRKQKSNGVWDVWPHEDACSIPYLNRMVPTTGNYKIIINGRYSALNYKYRSNVRFAINVP
jgi:hypothetical protein